MTAKLHEMINFTVYTFRTAKRFTINSRVNKFTASKGKTVLLSAKKNLNLQIRKV